MDHSDESVGGSKFIDAQGKPIHVKSVRIADVKFGSIIFRDRFLIVALTSPLVWMNRLLKMVGSYRPMRTATCLRCAIPGRSLRTSNATLCVLLESPECCPQMIRVFMFALQGSANQHVDTTLCPSDCLLWLRIFFFHTHFFCARSNESPLLCFWVG